ncbi:MAG: hypothetical protein IH586_18700 [Anaerolineaceae bacterium]|nr:hypothetical protein [Anaerolineaceae bacterium]
MHNPPRLVLLLILLTLGLILAPQGAVNATSSLQAQGVTGGVNILSTQPMLICVGDTVLFDGAASVDFPPFPDDVPLAPLAFIDLQIKAQNGQVTPSSIYHPGDFTYFKFTYKATKPGTDMLTLVLNSGVATYQEPVRVEEKCDYDAFLMTVIDITVDLGDEIFHAIATVNGTGTMKRDRQGSEFLQGDGTWHMEENVLSKPPMCVEYYNPPLITGGPFDLDGHLDHEGALLDVIVSFKPRIGEPIYHGKTICIDEDGDLGEGWSNSAGGNPALASKIETSVPLGGGSTQVELTGAGMQMIQSQGNLDYTATLTIIPR